MLKKNKNLEKSVIQGYNINKCSFKIMFLGNSITRHTPKKEIGWNYCHGMAASCSENDYVHIVVSHLNHKFKNKVNYCIHNCGYWELDYVNKEKMSNITQEVEKYNPDIVVVRLGDNFNKSLMSSGNDPFIYYDLLLKNLKKKCSKVVVTSLFWEIPELDKAIKKATEVNCASYVYITDISNDPSNEAIGLFEHQGVALHPGDKGMREIGNRIINKLDCLLF